MRVTWAELDAGRAFASLLEHPVKVRRIVCRVELANRALAGWPTELSPSWVKHQGIKVVSVEGGHVSLHHLGGVERREVVAGHGRRDLVNLKSQDIEAE